jgi:cyanophycinase
MNIEKLGTMKYLFTLFLLTIFLTSIGSIPGKLLLIGGGLDRSSETAWNKTPYQWAVDNSINKRVAIIGYVDADDFYEGYFVNNCSALAAKYFKIASAEDADNINLYDSLITYGMVFIKGGNQANYYNYYKGTKTEEALEYIFSNGGVIAGTSAGCAILSNITYAALNSSVDPLSAIKNYQSTNITLRDDFLDFFPGYVFDTHFGERGRFGRLVAFLENWQLNAGENIIGVGVDDLTAMSIDTNMIGTVYGTGSVNVFEVGENSFNFNEPSKVLANNVSVKQLLHGCTYNFETKEIRGLVENSQIDIEDEMGNYTILASGYELITRNEEILNEFVSLTGENNIAIVTSKESSIAEQFKSELLSLGASSVEIVEATVDLGEDFVMNEKIMRAKKFLIIDNEYSSFMSYLETTNGIRLKIKLKADKAISAFIGDNSRFVGKCVVNGYEISGASYNGNLTFNPGLELLQTTVIMPKSYFNSDTYENKATGVPRAMLEKNLKYGIWLNRYNYVKYYTSNGKTYVTGNGESPIIMLVNNSSKFGFSNQTSRGDGTQTPRMASGFDNMTLHFFDSRDSVLVGNEIIETSFHGLNFEKNIITVSHCADRYLFKNLNRYNQFTLIDTMGRIHHSVNLNSNRYDFAKQDLQKGVYIASFSRISGEKENIKIIIQ